MATPDEIERRVQDADSARSARRSAAAKRVGELALHRTAITEQLAAIERELGDVLAESSDVVEVEELARFTDLPVADLVRWRDNRKTKHTKKNGPPLTPPTTTPAPDSPRQGLRRAARHRSGALSPVQRP